MTGKKTFSLMGVVLLYMVLGSIITLIMLSLARFISIVDVAVNTSVSYLSVVTMNSILSTSFLKLIITVMPTSQTAVALQMTAFSTVLTSEDGTLLTWLVSALLISAIREAVCIGDGSSATAFTNVFLPLRN